MHWMDDSLASLMCGCTDDWRAGSVEIRGDWLLAGSERKKINNHENVYAKEITNVFIA